ncbi:tetratricopeptide repeat protein [Solemya velum gill symbiont]|uniref:tetratricopeptide repeat protein n=1 Tax=Solemya velum gill symbiont TaxID=2340 RepID=UPI000998B0B7|nr:tetratricopeptide repeat protein [Solemya velum gill symbiont]
MEILRYKRKHVTSSSIVAFVLLLVLMTQAHGDVDKCIKLYNEASYQQAFEPCNSAAENGHAQAQTILGEFYDDQGEVEKAHFWWEQASSSGYLPARNLLAQKHYYGGSVLGKEKGWQQSYSKAMSIWKEDAFMGVATAQFMVGEMYLTGKGMEPNLAEGWAWMKLASNNGYKLADDLLYEFKHQITAAQHEAAVLKLKEYEKIIKGRNSE